MKITGVVRETPGTEGREYYLDLNIQSDITDLWPGVTPTYRIATTPHPAPEVTYQGDE